jgi:hypothetical protein
MASKKSYPPEAPTKYKAATTPKADTDFQQASDERRLKDVESARTIFNRLETDNMLRSETIAQTRNQLEGGRPYDPAIKAANGTAWECNVNFGEAQATCERVILPYHKMVNDVPHKAAFTIDSNAPQSEKWQAAFAEAFDEFLYDWGAGYDLNFRRFTSNLVKYGPGIVQFCDDETARYSTVNVERIYFPKNTRMCPDEWEVVGLTRDMSATELYSYIRTEKTQERSEMGGWNSEAIKLAIVQSKDGGTNLNAKDFTEISDMLVNNDIAVTTPFMPLRVAWLYVRQFPKEGEDDGKIGCYVFTKQDGVNDFLYKDEDAAESFRHLLPAVWYDTGVDGMVHSIKGFGIKNFFFSALSNRMKSRFVDSATVALGMNFQYNDNNTPDETPPVENYGPFTIFPSGLTQIPVYPQLQAAQGVLEMLEQNQAENNSQYRQNQQQIAQSDTATQANILANQQGQVTEAQASTFLSQFGENILTEQVRRLRIKGNTSKDAKNFVRRLKERGVPDEVIFKHEIRVRTGANAGMANPVLRTQIFQELLTLSKLPGVNQRWILENFIANKLGANAVSKALLPEGAESNPVQRREAIMENTNFGQGIMLPVAPSDAHFEHLQEHLKPLAGILQAFQQNGQVTPEQASTLAITIEHAGMHMTYLSQDETMKQEFSQMKGPFSLIQSQTRGILTQMQNQMQQQGGPQPVAAMTG